MEKIRQHYFLFDPQPVRLADVFIVGPLIVYAGAKGDFEPIIKNSLIAIGIGTIVYNGVNYFLNEKQNGPS